MKNVDTTARNLRGNLGQNKARGEPMVPCKQADDVVVPDKSAKLVVVALGVAAIRGPSCFKQAKTSMPGTKAGHDEFTVVAAFAL